MRIIPADNELPHCSSVPAAFSWIFIKLRVINKQYRATLLTADLLYSLLEKSLWRLSRLLSMFGHCCRFSILSFHFSVYSIQSVLLCCHWTGLSSPFHTLRHFQSHLLYKMCQKKSLINCLTMGHFAVNVCSWLLFHNRRQGKKYY